MAKRPEISKTQAVHDYVSTHPDAMSSEIAAALSEQGIDIKPGYVANIKTKINKTREGKKAATKAGTKRAKKRAKKAAAVEAAAPAAPAIVEKPAKGGEMITLEHVRKAAEVIAKVGGFHRVTELLEIIRELGGVKKFRDLAEAMSTTAYDDIPF